LWTAPVIHYSKSGGAAKRKKSTWFIYNIPLPACFGIIVRKVVIMCHLFNFSRLRTLDHNRTDDLLSDYCDTEDFKRHPLFSIDFRALQILFFFDELEICNPLGSRANIHKLGK
jgi:hypothetical protein